MSNAIELKNAFKTLGSFHLGPLTLNIPRGTIYGLIGPNSAGKTTTLDLLMGMGQLDSGEMRVLDRIWDKDEVEIKRRVAYVSPDLNYQAWGTVGRALSFVSGFYPDWDQVRCERLQIEFKLADLEQISTLSFGSRIKLALIMALARDAELLLLDEPTVGLDAVSRRQLFTELLAFMQREDRTIVISSHQLSDLERFADHIAIINRGKVLTSGRVDQLIDRYRLLHIKGNGENLPRELKVTRHLGERTEALIDLQHTTIQALASQSVEIISDTALSLEDLFLALIESER